LDVGLDDPVGHIAIEFLSALVEYEGRAAFDKLPILGIEIRVQRRMCITGVDVPTDASKAQRDVRGHRFEGVPIGDVLQTPAKVETTTPHDFFRSALAAESFFGRRRDFSLRKSR